MIGRSKSQRGVLVETRHFVPGYDRAVPPGQNHTKFCLSSRHSVNYLGPSRRHSRAKHVPGWKPILSYIAPLRRRGGYVDRNLSKLLSGAENRVLYQYIFLAIS
jgi:hypothetical protein